MWSRISRSRLTGEALCGGFVVNGFGGIRLENGDGFRLDFPGVCFVRQLGNQWRGIDGGRMGCFAGRLVVGGGFAEEVTHGAGVVDDCDLGGGRRRRLG